ncbi:hypothetical protein Dimus_004075 [Dionaea muscipula]
MVSDLKSDGGSQNLSANLQKTIQSIKEVVRNHSESEIYLALKEANMNADETAQKLLNQEPFHEVRRKRDKKKENADYSSFEEPRQRIEHVGQAAMSRASDHGSVRTSGYARTDAGSGREFRVVRDNRVNQNMERVKNHGSIQERRSTSDDRNAANVSDKSAMGASSNPKHFVGRHTAHPLNRMNYFRPRLAGDTKTNGDKKEYFQERKSGVPSTVLHTKIMRQNRPQSPISGTATSNSVVGVYASASDPVHVPNISSRPPAAIGAMRREVGAVGFRRQFSGNSFKQSSRPGSSNSNSVMGSSSAVDSFRVANTAVKNDHAGHVTVPDSLIIVSGGRGLLNNNHGRSHQLVGHQKGAPPNKEWKPKPNQKPNGTSPGVIGTPMKSSSPPVNNSKGVEAEVADLQDKLSEVNIQETQNVIIAQHIRVSENHRCRLTFGSFGADSDTHANSVSEPQVVRYVGESMELSGRDDVSAGNPVNAIDEQVRSSGSSTPSGAQPEHVLPDMKESSSPPTLENYDDLGLVDENSQALNVSEPQQHQDPSELPCFSAYDPQTSYDVPYFRHPIDEAVRVHGLPSAQEVLTSHSANSVPSSSSMTMMQQQTPLTQLYPQVHVSHFPSVMPYRQFLSPVYVPPMGLPGYPSNPAAYPHPSNGNSYVLMPGGSSHLNANSLKYGIQQFKPVHAAANPAFGNFTSPTGYAMSAPPGIVGGTNGLEDSSRIKYKDGNLYLQNPQSEASEVWVQTPRELPGMQSAPPYYNMQGQAAHPAAYLQSHTGHASPYAAAAAAAAAVAHSSHMQFPGLYHHHPQQPAAMTNANHLATQMGGNAGVGIPSAAAPGAAQIGAFQQPQLGHLNWATNF